MALRPQLNFLQFRAKFQLMNRDVLANIKRTSFWARGKKRKKSWMWAWKKCFTVANSRDMHFVFQGISFLDDIKLSSELRAWVHWHSLLFFRSRAKRVFSCENRVKSGAKCPQNPPLKSTAIIRLAALFALLGDLSKADQLWTLTWHFNYFILI